jgi:hypothetical protein
MRRMRCLPRPGLTLTLLALAGLGACRETVGPTRAVHPVAGTYDVTAVLDRYAFETGGPIPPSCMVPYCTHYRYAADGALMGSLIGSVVVADTVDQRSFELRFPLVSGTFSGRFCAAHDMSGCLRLGDSVTTFFPRGTLLLKLGAADTSGSAMVQGPEMLSPVIYFFVTRFAGDSMYGRLSWSLTVNRMPPTYSGAFVARRRR